MTEKRFKHHMGLICEKRDGEYYSFTVKEVCDLLNALYEEIMQLKSENQELQRYLSWQDMELEEMESINDD